MRCLFDKKDNFMLNKTESYVRGGKTQINVKVNGKIYR